MNMKTWYTVRNIEKNVDILDTVNKKEVIEYLSDKDLSKFRVDKLTYKPVVQYIPANEFIKNENGQKCYNDKDDGPFTQEDMWALQHGYY